MKKTIIVGLVFCTLIFGLWISSIFSGPAVLLTTKNEWQGAIDAGQIQQVASWNSGFEGQYPGMSGQLRVPNLQGQKDVNPYQGGPQQGMIMAIGSDPPDNGQDIIGAFEYVFGFDADMTNSIMVVDALSVCAMTNEIHIGLRDASGNIRCWSWLTPSNLPCDALSTLSINPYLGAAGASPAPDAYYEDTGFDLTQVPAMIFDMEGTWVNGAPSDPAGFGQLVWNGWRNLSTSNVVPAEQSTWGQIKNLFKD